MSQKAEGLGDVPRGLDDLVPILHKELKLRAHLMLRSARNGATLSTTVLVNEAYLRLARQRTRHWSDRNHFLCVAAKVMRSVLIDYVRRQRAAKRGGGRPPVSLRESIRLFKEPNLDLLALDSSLRRLEEVDARKARVVDLRFWGGLTVEETASALGISVPTVHRDWSFAKAWLYRDLKKS